MSEARDGRSALGRATSRPSCTTDSAATTRRWPAPEPRASTTTRRPRLRPSSSSSRPPLAPAARRRGRARSTSSRNGPRAAGTDWALGILARSRALLADGEAADALYREAIERLGRTPDRRQLARAHLLYGEWLRRENRRLDAREQLRIAHERSTRWAPTRSPSAPAVSCWRPARRSRKRRVETRDRAHRRRRRRSPRLAAAGLTNPEIGSELFISPRTVEYHLSKVYTKLGITSRRELRKALPRQDQDAGR